MQKNSKCALFMSKRPLQNEYQANGHDENPSDDQPFYDQNFEYEMDDIRSMVRTVKVVLYVPNFSKRYTINLGKIDPPGLFWNRRIFIETKYAAGNYHAFLYAKVQKNQRNFFPNQEEIFLGYALLSKIDGDGSNSQQRFSEYQLSIPINANRLFKQIVLHLTLNIFKYEEGNNSNQLINENNLIAEQHANNETNECPICLVSLNSEKLTMKLHEDHNQNSQHIFHKECITKWIEADKKVRCPLCNKEPKFVMTSNFFAIFYGPGLTPDQFPAPSPKT
uniref:RING-type domain-containing protein n=1 Tax=Globodera rostochiensis TaxID=31243 RepID=A0A914IBB9_GLORO